MNDHWAAIFEPQKMTYCALDETKNKPKTVVTIISSKWCYKPKCSLDMAFVRSPLNNSLCHYVPVSTLTMSCHKWAIYCGKPSHCLRISTTLFPIMTPVPESGSFGMGRRFSMSLSVAFQCLYTVRIGALIVHQQFSIKMVFEDKICFWRLR